MQQELRSKIEKTIKKKIDWRNKAFHVRSESIKERMADFDSKQWFNTSDKLNENKLKTLE